MRTALFALLLLLLHTHAYAETPRQFAERFYRQYFRWELRGIPTNEEQRRLSPYFSAELLRLWAAAYRQHLEFIRLNPIDPAHPERALKPPWCKEGDVLCDNYEGISTFAIGRSKRIGGRTAVPVHLEWTEGSHTVPWTDTLLLERTGSDWVVADILYARGSSLVAEMREGIREAAPSITPVRQ